MKTENNAIQGFCLKNSKKTSRQRTKEPGWYQKIR